MFPLLSDLALKLITLENIVVFLLGLSIGYILPRKKLKRYEVRYKTCYKAKLNAYYQFSSIYKDGYFVKNNCKHLKESTCDLDGQKCHCIELSYKELKKL